MPRPNKKLEHIIQTIYGVIEACLITFVCPRLIFVVMFVLAFCCLSPEVALLTAGAYMLMLYMNNWIELFARPSMEEQEEEPEETPKRTGKRGKTIGYNTQDKQA